MNHILAVLERDLQKAYNLYSKEKFHHVYSQVTLGAP